MKRLLSLLLSLLMILPCVAFTPAAAEGLSLSDLEFMELGGEESVLLPEQVPEKDGAATPDGLVYDLMNGQITVFDYAGTAEVLRIPGQIDGYPVTTLASSAFMDRYWITSVELGEGITTIMAGVFNQCRGIQTLYLPSTLIGIGNMAFGGCTALTDVYYNGTQAQWEAISIGKNNECLTGATIHFLGKHTHSYDHSCDPDCNECGEVRQITHSYDHSCDPDCNLCGLARTITHRYVNGFCEVCGKEELPEPLPDGLGYEIVDGEAIITEYTGNLARLVIPETIEGSPVREIQADVFPGNTSLVCIYLPDGLRAIGNSAFASCTQLAEVRMPDSLMQIGEQAFYNCQSLTSLEFPEGLTSIGVYAFMDCIHLQTVKLPAGFTAIGNGAFARCYRLVEVITDTPALYTPGSSGIGAVAYYAEEAHSGPGKIVRQGDFVFYPVAGGYKLVAYLGGDSIPVIPDMDQPCIAIRPYAFYNYASLQSIEIPQGLTAIGEQAFYECSSLKSITLPDTLTRVHRKAFENCNALADVYFTGTRAMWKTVVIETSNERLVNAKIHTQGDCDHQYVGGFCEQCHKFLASEHPYSENANEEYLVYLEGAVALAVTFSNKTEVETGWDHLYLYDGKGSLAYPYTTGTSLAGKRVTVMGDTLRIVLASDGDTNKYGFAITKVEVCFGHGCLAPAETDCDICGAVRQVSHHYENGVCKTCSWPEGLEYTLSDGEVSVVGYSGSAARLVIPATVEGFPVTSLTNYVFNSCKTLVEIRLPDSVRSIGDAMFAHCSALESIRLPAGLTQLNRAVLYNCDSLRSIQIPAGLTVIGGDAFGSCEKLERIDLPVGVTAIEADAFGQCKALAEVYYEGTYGEWGEIAIESGNSYLTSASIFYHYGRDHSFDNAYDATCNQCPYQRQLRTDGTILLKSDASTVDVGCPFTVYIELNALTDPVGSVNFHVLLSENLQYRSHEILVNSADFMQKSFDPDLLCFDCGVTAMGVTGVYPLLKLELVAVAVGRGEIAVSLSQPGEGVGTLGGDAKMNVLSGDPLQVEAIAHVCDFSFTVAEERYLKAEATCTEAALYYKSCACGEMGSDTFRYQTALGHDLGDWLGDEESHWRHCSVCGEDVGLGQHSYTDFWDGDCQICSAVRQRPVIGDVNRDGVLNFLDIQRIFTHRTTEEKLTGEDLIVADVNRDGIVNFSDIQRIYQHLSTEHKLF